MVQDALNRWWQPIMHFFGPPDKASVHSEKLMQWKVKMASNDDMRNQFLDTYVPKIWDLGLTLPDENLVRMTRPPANGIIPTRTGTSSKRSSTAAAPCNKERLDVRKWAGRARPLGAQGFNEPEQKKQPPRLHKDTSHGQPIIRPAA